MNELLIGFIAIVVNFAAIALLGYFAAKGVK